MALPSAGEATKQLWYVRADQPIRRCAARLLRHMLRTDAGFRRDEALTRLLGAVLLAHKDVRKLTNDGARLVHRYGEEKHGSRDSRR